MAPQRELAQYAIKSYRYLRLAIVVVVLSLIASVLLERAKTSCWEVSISAYYYTPVHAMFVGALVAIGVCLIAVKGSEEWEDMLLNVAGILAPIVAFVPTSPPSRSCASSPLGTIDAEAYLDNNILAFIIGGVVAIGGAWLIAKLQHRPQLATPVPQTKYGLLLCAALTAAGVIWYAGFRQSFLDHAHAGTAIAMFVMVGIVIAINSRYALPELPRVVRLPRRVHGSSVRRCRRRQPHPRRLAPLGAVAGDPRAHPVRRVLGGADVRALGGWRARPRGRHGARRPMNRSRGRRSSVVSSVTTSASNPTSASRRSQRSRLNRPNWWVSATVSMRPSAWRSTNT